MLKVAGTAAPVGRRYNPAKIEQIPKRAFGIYMRSSVSYKIPIRSLRGPSRISMGIWPSWVARWTNVVKIPSSDLILMRLDQLGEELNSARVPNSGLMWRLVAGACRRLPMFNRATDVRRLNGLIDAEAWTEGALLLIEIELPQWKLRRLIFEEGSWLCSVSRQSRVPDWLDDAGEYRHKSLPLAVLGALVAGIRCGDTAVAKAMASSVPRCPIELQDGTTISCDNFA
jgi:hypothetical protein